jgi:hypothetical protein
MVRLSKIRILKDGVLWTKIQEIIQTPTIYNKTVRISIRLVVIFKIESLKIAFHTEETQRILSSLDLGYVNLPSDFASIGFLNKAVDLPGSLPSGDRHWLGLRGTNIRRSTAELRSLHPRRLAACGDAFC